MPITFDAYVTAALFDRSGRAWFALGDGAVADGGGGRVQAHKGSALAACLHPSGEGVVTGGDDGRLVWTREGGAQEIGTIPGGWIDVVAASPASGLIAYAAGRTLHLRDAREPAFEIAFAHDKAVAAAAFEPKGRRVAAATYGGAALWYGRIRDQKPQWLKWAGSHTGALFSPDGRFLVTAMQENTLHGWKLANGENLRMAGYPSKVKSMEFAAGGRLLLTGGASALVVWPFTGGGGPSGQSAVEVNPQESSVVARVAARPDTPFAAAGLDDGRVWTADLRQTGVTWIKGEKGAEITALAVSADGRRLAWGDEDGQAAVVELQP